MPRQCDLVRFLGTGPSFSWVIPFQCHHRLGRPCLLRDPGELPCCHSAGTAGAQCLLPGMGHDLPMALLRRNSRWGGSYLPRMVRPSCSMLLLVGSVACSWGCLTQNLPKDCCPLPMALSEAGAGLASMAVQVVLVPMALYDRSRCSRCTVGLHYEQGDGCIGCPSGMGVCMLYSTHGTCNTSHLVPQSRCPVLAEVLCSAGGLVPWPLACLGSSPSVVVSSASALLEAGVWARSLPAEAATYS